MSKSEFQHRVYGDQFNVIGHTTKGLPMLASSSYRKPGQDDVLRSVRRL